MPSDRSPNASDLFSELAHINEELYKKNAELAEKNKIFSLLSGIEEIILSTVTDTRQISQQVARLIVHETGFRAIGIYLLKDNKLQKLALELSINTSDPERDLIGIMDKAVPTLDQKDNIMIRAMHDRTKQQTKYLYDILLPAVELGKASEIQEALQIKTAIAFPMQARGELLGSLLILLSEDEETVSTIKKDIMSRLVDVIGIALDNALLYQEIQDANIKLKQLDKLKDEFVTVASHELRTPLTILRSYIWMTLDKKAGPLSEKQRTYLDRAYSSTVRMVHLVNDMLNISRIESGRLRLNIQKTDLLSVINDTVEEVKGRADELGISITVESRALPPVLADEEKIKEVLINFIGNSLKFTPRGGAIRIRCEVSDDAVTTRVVDNGSGIPKEDQQRLFQKFGFAESSYKINKVDMDGTGLGLYICKSIIDLHMGTISAYSEGNGKGATFSFSLKIFNIKDYEYFQSMYADSTNGLGVVHNAII